MEINKKYLEGLKFHSSESKDVTGEGGAIMKQYTRIERDLTADDVLAVRETDSEVIFVTADGQKYNVPKKAAKAA